jgi:5-methylthioadenosine/S-adenosylhomocysteine deaminase
VRFRFGIVFIAFVAVVGVLVSIRGQARQPVSLLVSGGTVVTEDRTSRVIPNGAVAIAGDRIVDVGTADDLSARYEPADRIDARGQIIMPGLINTHTHAAMVLFRGLSDDRSLDDWLQKYIFPAEAKMVSPDFVRVGTRLAELEMIESGTTTFVDMYYFEDDVAAVTHDAGMRAVLGQAVIQFPVADAKTPQEGLARAQAFIEKWHNDALIVPAIAPHAPYTVDGPTLQASRALANKYNVPLVIHLAETKNEIKTIADAHHQTPAAWLDSLGAWNGRSIAAHGVWLTDEDMTLLAKRGVGLAHNPESNMKLASGVAAVPKWLAHGIHAGLGTDSAASSNDLDMFEVMRTASLLQKVSALDPQAMPAKTVVDMATHGGAEVIGMGDRLGSLEAGKLADVITVSVQDARSTPMYDALSHLVYVSHGDDVRNTIVGGRVLMRDRRVLSLNAEDVLRDARAMSERVRAAVLAPPAAH